MFALAFSVSAAADAPADRFVTALESDVALSEEARELIRSTWARCKDCDGEEFLQQGLALLSEQFRKGLEAYDADEYERCARIMRGLGTDANPFIAVNAAAYEIKALAALERLVEAGQRIAELTADSGPHSGPYADGNPHSGPYGDGTGRVEQYSYFAAEIDFLQGYCRLADLQYEAATQALQRFLETHPDAPQRLTIAAAQMLNELTNRVPEGIGEVVDLMIYSHRRLRAGVTHDTMQQRQQRIVELLDQLVEEAQNQEKSGSGDKGGGGGSSGAKSPSNPMSESRLPGSAQAEARGSSGMRDPRRASPGEMWGSMPPAQREQVLQALRDSFPSRYRQLVEQYYEELAKKP